MIRRTLKSGLLATVAVLAFLPTAAGAAPADAAAPQPVPAVAAQYPAYLVQLPARRIQHRTGIARHRTHRANCRTRHTHQVGCRTHRVHRRLHTRRLHRVAMQGVSYYRTLPAVGRVATHRARLNVRSGPGTGYRVVGHRSAHRLLALSCRTYGSRVLGNRTWYRLSGHRGYVSAHYVRTGRVVPWC